MSQTKESEIIWYINGHEFELDLHDADVNERFERVFDEMSETEKSLPKTGKGSDMIRAYCKMLDDVYDALFGNGSADKISGGKKNVRLYNETYESFLLFIRGQRAILDASKARISKTAQFSPNRAQRRSQKSTKVTDK